MRFSIYTILSALLFSAAANGQNLLGLSTSPYGGTNSLYLNPAFAADSRHSFYFNLLTFNAHVSNNYVRYNAPFSLLQLATNRVPAQYQGANGSVAFKTEYTEEILDGKSKSGTTWTELRGPSALVRLGDRFALGLTTRLRASAQFTNASEQILSVIRAGLENNTLYNIPNRDNQFSAHSNTYAEAGLTLAGTLLDDGTQRLSMGATVKRLQGLTSNFLINHGLTYRIVLNQGNLNDPYLQIDEVNAELGYSTYLQDRGRSVSLRQIFDANNPGKGWGADFGISYQLLDQENTDEHRLRIGIALNDLGTIRYRNSPHIQRYSIQERNRRLRNEDFLEVQNIGDAARVLRDQLTDESQNLRAYNSGLPATLSFNADLKITKSVFLNATYLRDLRSNDDVSMHQPTLLAITPRMEQGAITVAIPLLYINQTFTAGASVRLGPVFLGSDNLIGLLASSVNSFKPRGADVYAGINLARLRPRP